WIDRAQKRCDAKIRQDNLRFISAASLHRQHASSGTGDSSDSAGRDSLGGSVGGSRLLVSGVLDVAKAHADLCFRSRVHARSVDVGLWWEGQELQSYRGWRSRGGE